MPNPRLLLTGAFARRSRANRFCWGAARLRRTPRQQKRRALGSASGVPAQRPHLQDGVG